MKNGNLFKVIFVFSLCGAIPSLIGDQSCGTTCKPACSEPQPCSRPIPCVPAGCIYEQQQPCVAPYKFSIGPVYSRVRQIAHDMPTYKGNLWGIQAEFEYKPKNSLYADASALWNWGTLHAGPKAHVTEGVWEGDLGYTVAWGCRDRWMASFFTGFGYRKFTNDFDATSRTPAIDVVYENYYVPVGAKIQFAFNNEWRMGVDAKFLASVDQKLYVMSVKDTYWKEGKRPGWSAEIPVTWSKCFCGLNWLEVSAVPFFHFWQLGSASAVGLPTWKQIYWGGRLMAGVAF